MNMFFGLVALCVIGGTFGAVPGRKSIHEGRARGYDAGPEIHRGGRPHVNQIRDGYAHPDEVLRHENIQYRQPLLAGPVRPGHHLPNVQLRPVIGYNGPRRVVRRRRLRPAGYLQDPIYTAAQGPDVSYVEPQPNPAPENYHEEDYSPKPYEFGYDTTDENGNNIFRKESSDGSGAVIGSYGYKDVYGTYRTVEYTADDNGFRATVKSNEPGVTNDAAADTEVFVEPPPAAVQEKASHRRLEYAPLGPIHPGAGYQGQPIHLREGPVDRLYNPY